MASKKDERPEWLRRAHGKNCDCMCCHDYKPDHHRPIYKADGSGFVCPDCGAKTIRYIPMLKHMGKIPNVMGFCPGSPEERERRILANTVDEVWQGYFVGTDHREDSIWETTGWFLGEDEPMQLPRPGEETRKTGAQQQAGAIEYLTPDMLTTVPREAVILDVKLDLQNNFGAAVVLKLDYQGRQVLWTLRIKNNPNYSILIDKFGSDSDNWKTKHINLFLEQDSFDQRFYSRIGFPEQPAAAPAPAAPVEQAAAAAAPPAKAKGAK